MAKLAVAHAYEVGFPVTASTEALWSETLAEFEQRPDYGGPPLSCEVKLTVLRAGWALLHLDLAGEVEVEDTWDARRALESLNKRLTSAFREGRLKRGYDRDTSGAAKFFADASPRVVVRVPLLTGDMPPASRDRPDVEALVRSRLYAATPFWPDFVSRLIGSRVSAGGRELTVESDDAETAIHVAVAYISTSERPLRRAIPKPRRPLWAWASGIVACLTLGLSFAPLTSGTLIVLAGSAAVVALVALVAAGRLGASRTATAWGMSVSLLLVLFACLYGAVALASPGAVQVFGADPRYLREPLLLSLSLLTTVGVLDLQVHGWLRSAAYLEMLLVATLAGGAVTVLLRRASRRVDDAVSELRVERRG